MDIALQRILAESRLTLHGLHFFIGTQILDYAILIRQYRKVIAIARKVAAFMGTALHTVDLGGGFGIPYYPNDTELHIARFGAELLPIFQEIREQPEFAGTTFIVEPGRYLVGEGGIYVTRITTMKESRGKKV